MVGEIRDRETAEIAVQASLTGHLVLSTVHTNDAIGAITRMRDMKVEPFLLASTLRAVIAQRLVRRLCPACRAPVAADAATAAMVGLPAGTIVHEPSGCAQCGNSGYQGPHRRVRGGSDRRRVRRLINAGGDEVEIAPTPSATLPTSPRRRASWCARA
jgi:general secretion pathway protein E